MFSFKMTARGGRGILLTITCDYFKRNLWCNIS